MNVSWTVRILLVVSGLIVGFVGYALWADEAEHGGWTALDGYEEGYLFDGSVEIREVPWSGNDEQLGGSYEVRLVDGDTYEVAFIDREGQVLFTGTSAEVSVWLDDQGPQVFRGTREETTAWMDEQRATEKSFVIPGTVIAIGILLVIVALVPRKRDDEPRSHFATPHAPGI